MECKDGRVLAKKKPECSLTFGEAVYQATGYRCKDLPLTPEKILNGMKISVKKKTAKKKVKR